MSGITSTPTNNYAIGSRRSSVRTVKLAVTVPVVEIVQDGIGVTASMLFGVLEKTEQLPWSL